MTASPQVIRRRGNHFGWELDRAPDRRDAPPGVFKGGDMSNRGSAERRDKCEMPLHHRNLVTLSPASPAIVEWSTLSRRWHQWLNGARPRVRAKAPVRRRCWAITRPRPDVVVQSGHRPASNRESEKGSGAKYRFHSCMAIPHRLWNTPPSSSPRPRHCQADVVVHCWCAASCVTHLENWTGRPSTGRNIVT